MSGAEADNLGNFGNASTQGVTDMKVRIRRLRPDIPLPRYESDHAAAFDLAAADDVVVEPRRVALVPTGLVVEVPDGMFLGIFARSSTPLKRGLMVANGVGVIDADYCGPGDEIKVQLLNFTDAPVQVKRGDRLAQGIVLPSPSIEWNEVEEMGEPTRGGFGSTG